MPTLQVPLTVLVLAVIIHSNLLALQTQTPEFLNHQKLKHGGLSNLWSKSAPKNKGKRQPSLTTLKANSEQRIEGKSDNVSLQPTQNNLEPIQTQVAIVGAGVSGLVCAKELIKQGFKVQVFERADGVGGRVRTDKFNGFLLDRGFQVFIEEYPEVKKHVNYTELNLRRFKPGAMVYLDGQFHKVSDPFREPQEVLDSLFAPIGNFLDKLTIGIIRTSLLFQSEDEIFSANKRNTRSYLKQTWSLSDDIIAKFFRPFYEGIFLAPLDQQSSQMFNFVFKMFAQGQVSLPAGGIGSVASTMANELPAGTIRLGCEVTTVSEGSILLKNGQKVLCDAVVVAADPEVAKLLLKDKIQIPAGRSSTCFYFEVEGNPPIQGPVLILNGEQTTADLPVNNVAFVDQCAPEYAPPGKSLASVTVVGNPVITDAGLLEKVTNHLGKMFGEKEVSKWKFLKLYRIPYAQPAQTPKDDQPMQRYSIPYITPDQKVANGQPIRQNPFVSEGIFCCGDHRSTATLNGAFESGFIAAKAVQEMLGIPL